MTEATRLPDTLRRALRRPVLLTRLGIAAENATRAFWPAWSVLFAALAALMLGLHEVAPLEVFWAGALISILAFLWTLLRGLRRFRWPSEAEAVDRLDRTMPGRPLTALADEVAVGAGDAGSLAVWQAHLRRMAERASGAKAEAPDLRISARDPYALRYVALTAFVVAALFGSFWRVASVAEMGPGGGQALASGPTWEGWVEPPAYTGKPSLYLADLSGDTLRAPEGSRVTVRLYGEVGALSVEETVSGRAPVETAPEDAPGGLPMQSFEVVQPGRLAIEGPGGRAWDVVLEPDMPPSVALSAGMERGQGGETRQTFVAADDYGVMAGTATITLDLESVWRAHGLAVDPDPREPIVVDLPMPFSGDRTRFEETLVENFSEHPWANLPVKMVLEVVDARGQVGRSDPVETNLGGRRFFDPLAQAIIEQRRDLLWARSNARRVAQILRAVSYAPEDGLFPSETVYLRLRVAIRRLEAGLFRGELSVERQEEVAQALWDIANEIEFGDLDDALQRLQRAQERLSEAMENGASEAEIAELMQELREAMDEYMRQLAENAQPMDQQQAQGDMQMMTGDQLQEMLDRIQELMEQGRMDEAQRLLDQLAQMMQNMQVVQGQPGQQGQGQQALRDLNETLRGQQGLSDDTFRDLQEQFGQEGQQPGQGQGENGDLPGSLAERQQALRNELNRQRQNLPGAGTAEGDAARESLGRAEDAMDGAEQALREGDIPEALDRQADAMEALREGIRSLGEALAQEQQQGQQGPVAQGGTNPDGSPRRDPLGRDVGSDGAIGTDEKLLQGEDAYRRADELMDEIQRRSGERDRPEVERDYLRRLLDRF